MEKLDLKDRKILYYLDLDSRQSFRSIGRKVGLDKDAVANRVKKLKDKGIIKNFFTVINSFILGYDVIRIYINFQYVSSDIKNEIIQYFVNYKDVWAVKTSNGDIDLTVIFWVKDNYEFYKFWNKTLDLYEDYFSRASISLYIQARDFKKSYLLLDNYEKSDREFYRITCSKKIVKIDKYEYKILNEIALNARFSTLELAKKLDISTQMVTYRIKNLKNKGLIIAYRILIDYSKLGLNHYIVFIYLKDHKKLKNIISYLNDKPYLQCLNIGIGWSDIQPEFVLENIDKLNKIIEEINSKFPNVIKKYTFCITEKYHKERWLPEMEF